MVIRCNSIFKALSIWCYNKNDVNNSVNVSVNVNGVVKGGFSQMKGLIRISGKGRLAG